MHEHLAIVREPTNSASGAGVFFFVGHPARYVKGRTLVGPGGCHAPSAESVAPPPGWGKFTPTRNSYDPPPERPSGAGLEWEGDSR